MVSKDGLHLTNGGTAVLADNCTKHLNINLGIDFNVNRNFNNDFLDWQLSRAEFSDIDTCIKDVGHKSQSKKSNKNDLCTSSEILADSFSNIKKARIENINNVIIGNLNINSFPNKFDELKVLVNGMLDILILIETKLDNTFPVWQSHIDVFFETYCLNRNRNGGGVIIHVKVDIPSKLFTRH